MYILFLFFLSTFFFAKSADQLRTESDERVVIGTIYSQETNYFGEGAKYRGGRSVPYAWHNLQTRLVALVRASQKHSNPANYFASNALKYIDESLWKSVHRKQHFQSDLDAYWKKKDKLLVVYSRYLAVKKRADQIECSMVTALFEQEGIPLVDGPDADPNGLPDKTSDIDFTDSSATPSTASLCSSSEGDFW